MNVLWYRWTVLVLTWLGVLAGCRAYAQTASVGDLQQQVAQIAAGHHGHVALYARQLRTGAEVGLMPDQVVQTASVIKLGLLYEAMVEVREGKARWDEKLTLPAGYAVGGSGVLQFFDAGLQPTLKDVLSMMVIVSDNTATDLAIDRLTTKAVDERLAGLGLKNTWLYKRIGKPPVGPMPDDQPKFGLGKTTPREMGVLMETIGRCELRQKGRAQSPGTATFEPPDAADRAVCEVTLHMLRSQFYRDTVPRYLDTYDTTEQGSGIASKTGSLNAVRNDVAIVGGKSGPILISAFTYDNKDQGWTVDNEAEVTIARLARAIVTAWSPNGIDGAVLTPGLGLAPAPAEAKSPAAGGRQ